MIHVTSKELGDCVGASYFALISRRDNQTNLLPQNNPALLLCRALKASAHGPALLLFTAFGLLLTGGVFLVFSTALSAGVLSPAKALAFSHSANFPSVSLAGFLTSTQRSRLPEALANTLELELQNGTESTEAIDLMPPSDPKARVDILKSQLGLDGATGVKTGRVAESVESSVARLRGSKDGFVGAPAKTQSVADLTEVANLTVEAVLDSIKNSSLSSAGEVKQTNVGSKADAISKTLQGLDADELFEAFLDAKALAVDQKAEKGPVSKIAFLFLTRGALFHERLWQRFFEGNENRYSIYVHASKEGFMYNETTSRAPVFYDRQIKSIKVRLSLINVCISPAVIIG